MARIKYYDPKSGKWEYADHQFMTDSGKNIDEVYILFEGESITDVPEDAKVIIDPNGDPDFDLSGYVQTVNGIVPDENGNVEIAAPNSGGSIAVTGAKVGQTVKISAVDANGAPTAWEPMDVSYTKSEIDAIMGSYITDIDNLVGGDV